MILSTTKVFAIFGASLPVAHGHAFMKMPPSRNFVANQIGKGWDDGTPQVPFKEYTPQGLNVNMNVCGKEGGNKDYDDWLDMQGQPMPWISQASYGNGDEIQVDIVVTAHHLGHFTLSACPMGRASTQNCFDANPLEFVEDTMYGMPKDAEYPNRAMLWGDGVNLSYKFKLPNNLVGEEVLLQWIYWTANSCNYDGYKEYFNKYETPKSNKGNWSPNLSDCGPTENIPIQRVGGERPEIFVNCAEVTIGGESSPSQPIIATPTPKPSLRPVEPPQVDDNVVGTCGMGQRGNGICPAKELCCSEWGYCGTIETGHCDGTPLPDDVDITPPVANPNPPTPITNNNRNKDSRMIAYVGNWQPCPTDKQMEQYTEIVVAFAVSYTWSPGKNICSQTCEIDAPPTCNNEYRPDLIQKWKGQGKKIILSFGGAGMGGSWSGDNNDCWDYCFGRETKVVNRLTAIVNEQNLDGVDIDYEYFYEDKQNGSNFNKGKEAQKFLKDVTVGLRSKLPAGSEITHAPMEPDMEPGRPYFELLKDISHTLDFLMPQYYNGYQKPYDNFQSALDHFTIITNDMFGGDASKVVFGFCISECGPFNLNGVESANVMENLAKTYPCNGGAFFWVADGDKNANWSSSVTNQLQINSDVCSASLPDDNNDSTPSTPEEDNQPAPAPAPAPKPKPKPKPAPAPAPAPVNDNEPAPVCKDDSKFKFKGKVKCKKIKRMNKQKKKKICKKKHNKKDSGTNKKMLVSFYCPKACKVCK